ncbi:putative ribonuclease D [Aeromicrobium marinum DSM 15272]|uniref:Ribonuclease D n=1 Tax=Aeromicrobium marinum DSM 15272 TaxID=585531 RepID=E2S9A0_9ACTN|nr:putative ribonuclease D [Aeromicrobium marinum DSM 15272]
MPDQNPVPDRPVEPPAPPSPPLTLRDPLPPVVDTAAALAETCAAVARGSGPVALDAERASGYRYSQRAYLVQLRREGSGTHLVDPIGFGGLEDLDDAIGDAEWILHAATQDLPCLAEIGLRPRALFDTEHAGRLLNLPRVGLATLVEHFLGRSLAKEHSAADWSTRPLPEPWLVYAALDVEVLVELRDLLDAELREAGKREWAAQDFEALLSFTGPPEKTERWRRTSGMHRVRGRRTLALVRALWLTRDEIAEHRDTTPGRILPDAALVEIATAAPQDMATLKGLRGLRGQGPRRYLSQWHDAVENALALPEADLPTVGQRTDGPPPPRAWVDKFPEAAARLARCRDAVTGLAEEHDLPTENLISPHLVRALAWEPPAEVSTATVSSVLRDGGARPWQIDLVGDPLVEALV